MLSDIPKGKLIQKAWAFSTRTGAPYSPKRNVLIWVYLGTYTPKKSTTVSATWYFDYCKLSQKSCPITTLNQAFKKKNKNHDVLKLLKLKKGKKYRPSLIYLKKGCCWIDVLDPLCLWQWEMPLNCFHLMQPLHKAKQRQAGMGSRQA